MLFRSERLAAKHEHKVHLVGNPVRDAVLALRAKPYPLLEEDGIFRVLVTGGSQGASILSQVVPDGLAMLPVTFRRRLQVTHQARIEDIDAVRAQYAGLGRQIVARAFERAGKVFADEKLKESLPRLARQSVDDVLAAVGRGEMFSGDVVKAVHPDFVVERKVTAGPAHAKGERGWFGMKKAASLVFKDRKSTRLNSSH